MLSFYVFLVNIKSKNITTIEEHYLKIIHRDNVPPGLILKAAKYFHLLFQTTVYHAVFQWTN